MTPVQIIKQAIADKDYELADKVFYAELEKAFASAEKHLTEAILTNGLER